MTEQEIKYAINFVSEHLKHYKQKDNADGNYVDSLQTLINLAEQVIESVPLEYYNCDEMGNLSQKEQGYNQALTDYRLWLIKKCGELDNLLDEHIHLGEDSGGGLWYTADKEELLKALRSHFGVEKGE